MKNPRYFLLIIVVIVLLPIAGHLLWRIQKERPMDLMIVNKTVPRARMNETKSLNWVLNYHKFQKKGKENYHYSRDYYGFFPDAVTRDRSIKAFRLEDLSELPENYDGLVYLDNEGVDLETSKHSRLGHYGGFNNTDYLLFKEMISQGKLVVVEHNFFSEPTEELIRFNTEQLMDIYSLHWQGKYFKNLSEKKIRNEIDPKWLKYYEDYHQNDWSFKGPGLILCNSKQNRIIVLPEKQYMFGLPFIRTDKQISGTYQIPGEVCYTGWFQVIYEGGNEVISTMDLNLNEEGVNILKSNGLEPEFPVSVKVANKPVFFLAGDFSKQNVFLPTSKVRLISDACRSICMLMPQNPSFFFQTYYFPLMSAILEDNSIIKEES